VPLREPIQFIILEIREDSVLGPSHEQAEIVLNLWAYSDDEGYIRRLAGKCYALHGNDADKLSVLRALAKSDFLTAQWEPVPDNYGVIHLGHGEERGVATTNEVLDPDSHAQLFGALINRLEANLPEQVLCAEGQYRNFELKIPQEPLRITTIVIEQDDGRLVPVVNTLK
jgi:hypothetical protein